MSDTFDKGKLLIEPNLRKTLSELNTFKIKIPEERAQVEIDWQAYKFPPDADLVNVIDGKIEQVNLDAGQGYENILNGRRLVAYDESIEKYLCLEGTAYVAAHSIVTLQEEAYNPIGYVTMNFYTRAKHIAEKAGTLQYTKNTEFQAQRDYVLDKLNLSREHTENGSILFVDGPLIGGDVYTYMIQAMDSFLEKDIVPVFFVKNSNSNLVVDNIQELNGFYNSDLHWAYTFLKQGQRTNYFRYADAVNPDNSKIFCYVKLFEGSPQRVEFYSKTFFIYRELIEKVMDTIYYLALLQGVQKNPQIRLIAIAEKYAREYISLCDIKTMLRNTSITPTVNQERFER